MQHLLANAWETSYSSLHCLDERKQANNKLSCSARFKERLAGVE